MGRSIRLINSAFSPFFAATIQGSEKIFREFKNNPVGIGTRVAAYITLPTIALWLINFDDPNYQNQPWYIKDMYWLIPKFRITNREVPFGEGTITLPKLEKTGEFIKLPKPFEVGLMFGTSAERTLQWIAEHDPDFKAWMEQAERIPTGSPFEQYLENLFEQLIPGNLPPWLGPFLEVQSGYDFFLDREIVPESEQRLLAEFQAGPRQGETVRLLGKYRKMSPRKIENIISGTTGGLGKSVLTTADRILSLFGAEGPEEVRHPSTIIPLIGPMLRTLNQPEPTLNSKPVERFYRTWLEVGATVATIRNLESKGQFDKASILTQVATPEVLIYDFFQQTSQDMSAFRQRIREVMRNEQWTREQREETVLQLGRTYRLLAATAVLTYNHLKDNLEQGTVAEELAPRAVPGTRLDIRPQVP